MLAVPLFREFQPEYVLNLPPVLAGLTGPRLQGKDQPLLQVGPLSKPLAPALRMGEGWEKELFLPSTIAYQGQLKETGLLH